MDTDNLTKAQIAYLWLNYQYYNVQRGFNDHVYQAISLFMYDRMKDLWSKLYYQEQCEVIQIQSFCDAMKDLAITLNDVALYDAYLATIKY